MDPFDSVLCQYIREELDNILEHNNVEVSGLLDQLVAATQDAFNRFTVMHQWGKHKPDGSCCDV